MKFLTTNHTKSYFQYDHEIELRYFNLKPNKYLIAVKFFLGITPSYIIAGSCWFVWFVVKKS